jgi:site-specific DNA-methyltransferase (cytosine-N4-specific)
MLSETIKRIDKIHPYPAKFTIDIAIKLIEKHSKIGDVVYDPFLGSGTTILACNLLERKAIGTDINHIAILISKFKTIVLNHKEKKELSYLIEVLKNLKEDNIVLLHQYKSIDHWFKKDVVLALSSILNNINLIKSINSKIFAQTIFSSIINLVSNQESDTRYAAIEKKVLNFNYVIELFIKKIQKRKTKHEVSFIAFNGTPKCSKIRDFLYKDSNKQIRLERKYNIAYDNIFIN